MGNGLGNGFGESPRLRAVIGLKPLVGLDELLRRYVVQRAGGNRL